MTSLPSSVYISDQDGSIYGNKAYVNQLTVIGNTQQAGVGSTPVLMTPSLAAANTFVYSTVANGVVSFLPTFNVLQDATGRARIASDLNIIGNVTATNYLNYPQYTLPSNLAVTSLTANVVQAGNLVSNTGSFANLTCNVATVGNLTVQSLSGYIPPTQNLTGNTLNYNTANLGQVAAVAGNIQTLSSNNVTVTGVANLGQVVSQNGNLQNIQSNNVTVAGIANLAQVQANNVTVSGLANVANLRYGTAVGNAMNVQAVMTNSIQGVTGNTLSIIANSSTVQFENVFSLTAQIANCANLLATTANVGTLYVSNLQGYTPPIANTQNLAGNSLSYTTILAGNIGPLAQVGNVLSNLNVTCTNLTTGNVRITGQLTANVCNVQSIGASQANLSTLQANVIYCANILGLSIPLASNVTDISGNSAVYATVKAGAVLANAVGILTSTPAFPLDVAGAVRATTNTSVGRATALRVENLGSSAGGAIVELASQFSGLAQANKVAAQMYAEPDSGTGARFVVTTCNTAGVLQTALNIDALQRVGVNTGSPAYPLDVNGQARFITNQVWHQANAPGFYIGNALSTNQSGFITFNNAGPPSGPGSLGLGVFGVGGLTVSGTGNVGVQQSQPAYLFDVGGTGRIPTLLSSNVATSAVSIPGNGPINFAYDNTSKDPNAGVIGYQRFSATCLDIIGAGTGPPNRAVRVWETLGVGMSPAYPLDISGTGRIPTLLSSNAQVTQANVVTLGATTLYCSNIIGYSPAQTSLTDISGNSATYSYLKAQTNLTAPLVSTGGGTISASNPYFSVAGGGDLIGLKFGSGADRYGLALNGGVTRVITSGVNATAQVGLSLASTDGPGASATGFADLLYASNTGVTVTRPFTAPTANIATLFCGNIVGFSGGVANTNNISGNSASYALVTAGNVAASNVSVAGNLVVQGQGMNLPGTTTIAYGYNVLGKEVNAGKIGYAAFSTSSLDVVGGGTSAGSRNVQIFDSLTVNTSSGNGSISAGNVTTSGSINYSTSNPGDMIVKAYGAVGDRYGVGAYQNGTFRVFTSSAFGPATLNLSLASTDGGSGTSSQWSDIVTVSQSSVLFNRVLVLPTTSGINFSSGGTSNYGYDVSGKDPNAGRIGYGSFSGSCLDIVGAGTGPPSRSVRIWEQLGIGMNPSNALDVAGNGRLSGSLSAASAAIGTFTGQPTFQTNQLYQKDNAPGFYLGRDFSTGNAGFITFNNAGPPSGPGTLGLGVYGQSPGGGLSVANTGYVGVNYSTPAFPLDVGGAVRISGNLAVNSLANPLTVNAAANVVHFLQGQGYQNLFLGNTQSTGGCGFLTFNNPTSPGYANSLGIGVYGAPYGAGITCSPNGSVGVSQTQPSASVSLDCYGPLRAQMSFFSQTFWNAGGTYTISSSNYSLVNSSSIFTALYTGNNQATDVSANSLWGSGATFFTIPVNGLYHLSIDGTLNATNTVATYWAFSKIGGMSQSPNYFTGQNTCTNNIYISSACTLALTAGDQPYAAFASGSVGAFNSKNLSVRITLLQRL